MRFYEYIHIKLCCQSKEEKTMVNKKFWLGILVIALVFGMVVVGCDNNPDNGNGNGNGDGGGGKTDSALNGTWVNNFQGEMTLYNGTFEWRYPAGILGEKGTYIFSGNTIAFTSTHHNGIFIGSGLGLENKL
jgi:hypothetical protein